jgi:hypothetical protein
LGGAGMVTYRLQNFKVFFSALYLMFCFSLLDAEEVGKFTWKGALTGLNTVTLNPPLKTVAMSEYVYASNLLTNLTKKDPCSIIFIIDNSASNVQDGTDPTGERFKATVQLLDYIYTKAPETRVGLVLFGSRLWFYKPDNTSLFQSVPEDQFHEGNGCYIPPLDLDKIYTASSLKGFRTGTTSYNCKGLDVLKLYLGTNASGSATNYFPTHHVNYPFISQGEQLTHITIAFDGAKLAHLSQTPPLQKNRHFNIFFSDGGAGVGDIHPDLARVNDYVKGKDVPTTFTFYYNPMNQSDLAKLQQMTTNIKNNGYSTNNVKLTNIWNLSNWQTIQQTLVNDVFNKILTSTVGTPINLTIGTTISTLWDNVGFIYKNVFPLQKGITPFNLNCLVHLKKDSLDANGNVISTTEKDTTLKINFNVTVGPGITIPDSMTLRWWGRYIALFNNSDSVIFADATMKNLQARFKGYKVDTVFGYKDVDLIISSKIRGDRDSFRLAAQGDQFVSDLKIAVASAPVPNNGTIELAPQDSIVMEYRNPYLPLDTIRKVIPFSESIIYHVTGAVYFDRTADGHVDEMFIGIAGDRLEKVYTQIVNALTLPAIRMLTKGAPTVVPGGIKLPVTEGAPDIRTYILPEDFVEVKDTVKLPEDNVLAPCKVTIIDSIAPVVMSAMLIDSVKPTSKDELIVDFSEDIKSGAATKPFVFIKQGTNANFGGVLEPKSGSGKTWNWFIKTLDGGNSIVEDDSLRISEKADMLIADNQTNAQINPANLKRPIKVKKIPDGICIERAVYYDDNADGFVDKIAITWNQKVGVIAGNLITSKLSLPSKRSFTMGTPVVFDNGITLEVSEGSAVINTAVGADEIVTITDTIVFSATFRVVPSSVAVTDSVAPVVLRDAEFRYSTTISMINSVPVETKTGIDSLLVCFSEGIAAIGKDKPFRFKLKAGPWYDAVCSVLSQSAQGADVIFQVKSVTGANNIADGDSLWIYEYPGAVNVGDLVGNAQNNPNNIKRKIKVIKHEKWDLAPLEFELRSTNPNSGTTYDMSVIAAEEGYFSLWPAATKKAYENVKNKQKGYMILSIVPKQNFSPYDSIVADQMLICDALGNVVLSNGRFGFYRDRKNNFRNNQAFYFWDCKNSSGRPVGSGIYLVTVAGERVFRFEGNVFSRPFKLKGFIAVRQ